MHAEIVVSPEDDIELRRTTITQSFTRAPHDRSDQLRRGGAGAGRWPTRCTRPSASCSCRPSWCPSCRRSCARAGRARRASSTPWMCHLMAVHEADIRCGLLRNRSRALHRARPQPSRPAAMIARTGCPTAPARCSIPSSRSAADHPGARPERHHRRRHRHGGNARGVPAAWSDKYRDRHLADRVFDLAWTHSQVLLRQLNATQADAQLYERLAGSRAVRQRRRCAPIPACWRATAAASRDCGDSPISGDLPIVLLQIADWRQHRTGAATGAGARLLAPQGPGGGPGDLERGSRRLSTAPAGPDHGPDRRRHARRG